MLVAPTRFGNAILAMLVSWRPPSSGILRPPSGHQSSDAATSAHSPAAASGPGASRAVWPKVRAKTGAPPEAKRRVTPEPVTTRNPITGRQAARHEKGVPSAPEMIGLTPRPGFLGLETLVVERLQRCI